MFTNLSKIPTKLGILLVGFGLLVAGCDSAGPGPEPDPPEEELNISYEVTNDLDDRITDLGDDGSSNVVTTQAQSKSSITFEIGERVTPPSVSAGDALASHLAVTDGQPNSSDDQLYIGYKVEGSEYGGGIDIANVTHSDGSLDASGGTNAAQVDGVDIQELAIADPSAGEPGALFAATAIEPGPFQRPPQFHAIELDDDGDIDDDGGTSGNEVKYEVSILENPNSPPPTRIAKSVVDATINGNSGAVAASDVNSLHLIETSSNDTAIDSVTVDTQSGAEFRSVTETPSGNIYALSGGGKIYTPVTGSPGMTEEVGLPGISDSLSIARMTSKTISGTDYLLVALNENGFRVYNTNTDEVVYSDTEVFATSVTAATTAATSYVFVANGDGFSFYEVEDSGLGNTILDDGLNDEGRASITDLAGSANVTTGQVNHIIPYQDNNDNLHLYVAKGIDGVYRLDAVSGNAYN